MKNKLKISIVLNIICMIMEIIGLYQCWLLFGKYMFIYYTQDSNILNLISNIVFLIFAFKALKTEDGKVPYIVHLVRFMAATVVTVTFIVVVLILAPFSGEGGYAIFLFKGSVLYLHTLCPIVSFVSFVFFEKEPVLDRKAVLYSLIPTFIYASIAIVLNILRVWIGPYFFLMVYYQPLYMSFIWAIVVFSVVYLISLIVYKLNRIKRN